MVQSGSQCEREWPCRVQSIRMAPSRWEFWSASSPTADAQTLHRHVRHPAAEGRQITVLWPRILPDRRHRRAGRRYSGYALDTISGTAPFNPGVDNTMVGVRGLERLPNNMTVPGCCAP